MASHDIDTVLDWRGSTVVDRDGERIGTFDELYLDQDDRPAWAAVTTGLFGLRQTLIPLADAQPIGDQRLQVPFDKDHVKAAPSMDPDAQLTEDEERQLYGHYEFASADTLSQGGDEPTGEAASDGQRAREGDAPRSDEPAGEAALAGTSEDERAREGDAPDAPDAPLEPDAPDAMTRSEEELVVGTRRRVRGRARLKKYVVTEHVQKTVPVQREEVRVEYEPSDPERTPADT
jgi:hypothetical protein